MNIQEIPYTDLGASCTAAGNSHKENTFYLENTFYAENTFYVENTFYRPRGLMYGGRKQALIEVEGQTQCRHH